jgi:hypothetical protein
MTAMRIPIGVFDFAAYTVPGVLYLAWLLLIADMTHVVPDAWKWLQTPTLSQTAGALLASYLIGHMTYAFSKYRLPWEGSTTSLARENFKARNPQAAARTFVEADSMTVLAAIEAHNMQWAALISSMHATSLMCRSCATALFAIALSIAARAVLTQHTLQQTALALAILIGGLLLRRAGMQRAIWAKTKTLECALWIPNVDAPFTQNAELPAATRPQGARADAGEQSDSLAIELPG